MAQRADDPSCLAFIRDRLEACHSHEDCHSSVSPLLPSRVVDISLTNNDIHLHETEGETGRYAALSYCWGERSFLLTAIVSNMESLKSHIPWQKLPKTIQDAIEVARMLGLRYIWIDSLCIVQNSTADWETEAAKMGQYYQHAYLTLAASSSPSASAGLFSVRTRVAPAKQVQFQGSDGAVYPLVVQSRNVQLWTKAIDDLGPLSDRGWTFQEHALSPRIIHFTEGEIFWECRTEMLSEDGHPIRNDCHSMVHEFREQSRKDPQSYWHFLVRAYSSRRLTYPKDRLPAIAGMADHFHRQTGHCYVGGLWKDSLPIDLVWSSWGWEEPGDPPPILPGPSWSWASIEGGVALIAETFSHEVQVDVHAYVHNVRCNVPGNNPFGEVTQGSLDIRGRTLEMDLQHDGEHDNFGFPRFSLSCDDITELNFFPDTSLAPFNITEAGGATSTSLRRSSSPPVPFHTNVLCLWIVTSHEEPPSDLQLSFGKESSHLHGIILAKSDLDNYGRIGTVGTKDTGALSKASERRLMIV